MKTEKKCKGTGQALDNGCGEMVKVVMYYKPNTRYGLGKSCGCYSKWLLTTDKGKQQVQRETLKATSATRSLNEAKETKKLNDSLSYLKTSVVTVCHNYIKARDKGKPCVSCGQPWHKDHQAGHWKKASDFSNLKFWEYNIHNQCIGCNIGKDGNVQEYGIKITLRITDEQKAEIERMASEYKKGGFKWDRIELNEIREYYKSKIKELNK